MPEIEQIKKLVPIEDQQLPILTPMYNISPNSRMPVITYNQKFMLQLMVWNYKPSWAGSSYKPIINAREESIDSKPYFKDSFEHRRCIIPAAGFYEWDHQTKQPYYIHLSDQPVFGFAGIYDYQRDSEGHFYGTYAIITTMPNAVLAPIHHRMPVILHRESLLDWIQTSPQEAKQFLQPYDTDLTMATKISKTINNPSVNDPHILDTLMN